MLVSTLCPGRERCSAFAQTTRRDGKPPAAPAASPALRPPSRGDYSARRIRTLSQQQRSAVLQPDDSRRSRRGVTFRAPTLFASGCSRTHRAFSWICTRTSPSTGITSAGQTLKYARELNAVFIDFRRHASQGAGVRGRGSLLRHADGNRTFRRIHVRHRSLRQTVDHDRERRSGREPLVAQQGPMARRTGGHGAERRHPERSRRCLQRQVSWQEGSRRWLHALAVARALSHQLVQRVAEHRRLRPLSPTSLAICHSTSGCCQAAWTRRRCSSRKPNRCSRSTGRSLATIHSRRMATS